MSITENTSGRQNTGSEKQVGPNETKVGGAKPQRKPEDEKRIIRCAFTGHRPQYLTRCEEDVRVDLENAIMAAIKDGYTTFISGLAYGVDIWAAEIVARMKEHNPALHLVAAIPFPDFSDGWTEDWKARYNVLLAEAEYVKVMAPAYSKEAYHARNRWLVDHSSRVIAVYNGEPSGTRNTILYTTRLHYELCFEPNNCTFIQWRTEVVYAGISEKSLDAIQLLQACRRPGIFFWKLCFFRFYDLLGVPLDAISCHNSIATERWAHRWNGYASEQHCERGGAHDRKHAKTHANGDAAWKTGRYYVR